jgi:alpha-amylase
MWNFEIRWEQNTQHFRDVSVLGNFIDNHDVKRFLNEQSGRTPNLLVSIYLLLDIALLKNALTYVMMAEGIPIVYQGTELLFDGGDDPRNRESMWPELYKRPSTNIASESVFSILKCLNK